MPASFDHRSKLVLGVDDATENLHILGATLMSAGYAFIGAAGGAECLSLVHRARPRLILLDIEMPNMDGFETCRRLRGMPELARVPIAFLTACKTQSDVLAGRAAGGNDFILKPFQRDRLLARVAYWIGHRPDAPPTSGPAPVPAEVNG